MTPCARATATAASTAPRELGDVAELLRVGQGAELLQALVLDLPDALAGDRERAADLVEGARLLAVQPVPELEHATLAIAERTQALRERLSAKLRRKDEYELG